MSLYTKTYYDDARKFHDTLRAEGIDDPEAIDALLRNSTTLQRLAVKECNGPGDYITNRMPYPAAGKAIDRWQKSMEKKSTQAEARVRKICEKHNLTPVFNGDPRGCVLMVKLPSGKTNDWNREGYCVPAPRF